MTNGSTHRYTALINPIAGGGAAARRWDDVRGHLPVDSDVTLVETRDRPHAVEAARNAAATGGVVVAVGGDGLVRDVATGVVSADGTMAVVPAGRGNDLVNSLSLPHSAADIGAMLAAGRTRHLDVLDVGGVIVPGNVYVGLDSLSTVIINRNRWLPARLLYRISPYLALARWRPVEYEVVTDAAEPLVMRGHIAVIANSGWYGHGLHIVPSACADDGRLDVLVVGAVPKYRLGAFMRDAQAGTHANWPEVSVVTGTSVTLTADRAVPVCADGDELGELPVTVRLRRGALHLITP